MAKLESCSSTLCAFCRGVNCLLGAKGVEFALYSVDVDLPEGRETMARGGGHTMPQVLIHHHPAAGFDQLTALDADDELGALPGLGRRSCA
ncbi:MAG TPA: glutaredoxin domain-containing protein [Gammaproteobacteria bacterium]|nr:glutaredoxin domain-containing protein [Gammaproteobacteria bacterium]